MAVDMAQIREQHGMAQAKAETALKDRIGNRYGTESLVQGHRTGFWDGVRFAAEHPEVLSDGPRDHAAEAAFHIDGVHDWQAEEGITDATLLASALIAQAEATLALVEQQRIANVIAWTVGPGYPAAAATAAEITAALRLQPSEPGIF